MYEGSFNRSLTDIDRRSRSNALLRVYSERPVGQYGFVELSVDTTEQIILILNHFLNLKNNQTKSV